jgi:hypothetical protein
VLDEHTIGFADYSGNRQYISTGNITGDNRVSLFLMDYPNQRRLKILGRASIFDGDSHPDLLRQLQDWDYRARVERVMVIRIEGFAWNCPKYITPRFTQDEVASQVQGALAVKAAAERAQPQAAIGTGELELLISGVRELTHRVRAFELRAPDWGKLPPAGAGAHIEVPVLLDDGTVSTRQYSLTKAYSPDDSGPRNAYEIAVLLEESGRGGSRAIHRTWKLGTRLRASPPINYFPLHDDERPTVLTAGGIGITPIKAMSTELKRRNVAYDIHYTARSQLEMAFHQELMAEHGARYCAYFSREPGGRRLAIDKVLLEAPANAVFYVCGPLGLIESVLAEARRLGIEADRVQYESFN